MLDSIRLHYVLNRTEAEKDRIRLETGVLPERLRRSPDTRPALRRELLKLSVLRTTYLSEEVTP